MVMNSSQQLLWDHQTEKVQPASPPRPIYILRLERLPEEIDSYLYQTVGQDAIEFTAQALDVPLYRKTINGTALEQGSEYGGRTANTSGGVRGDETEDLFDLLSTVKERHPDIQGVSVGAILSSYQRVRVEHVCRRLGLTVLAYLWQREQDELLQEMIDAGLVAVIIKVAGIGLTEKHLGKTLAEMQPTLVKLNTLYGSHICGEGGEYETLTLDCPLFKKRIRLTDVETVIHSNSGFAAVSYLRIKGAALEEKQASGDDLTIPPLLDPDFVRIQTLLHGHHPTDTSVHAVPELVTPQSPVETRPSTSRKGSWVGVGNVCRATCQDITFEEEVVQCFHDLQVQLGKHSLTLSQCTHIDVYLSSMDLFSTLNTIYATFFGASPPTRACVAVDLPPSMRIKFDCFAYAETDPSQRIALHVQGLSYWAPANIGPYSQAVLVDEHVFISGQIGLIPASLSLPSPKDPATETALVFQHTERVADAVRKSSGQWEGNAQLAIYWLVYREHAAGVAAACELAATERNTPTVLLGIASLPKGAIIEKQVVLHTGRHAVRDEEGIEEVVVGEPTFQTAPVMGGDRSLYYEISSMEGSDDACAIVCISGSGPRLDLERYPQAASLAKNATSIRLFHLRSIETYEPLNDSQPLFEGHNPPAVTTVPVRFIITRDLRQWNYALCIFSAGIRLQPTT